MIRFACPACKALMEAPPHKAGQKIDCLKCGQRLQISQQQRGTILARPAPPVGAVEPSLSAGRIPSRPAREEPEWVMPRTLPWYVGWLRTCSKIYLIVMLVANIVGVIVGLFSMLLVVTIPIVLIYYASLWLTFLPGFAGLCLADITEYCYLRQQ